MVLFPDCPGVPISSANIVRIVLTLAVQLSYLIKMFSMNAACFPGDV